MYRNLKKILYFLVDFGYSKSQKAHVLALSIFNITFWLYEASKNKS
jgi:hypothetical protein